MTDDSSSLGPKPALRNSECVDECVEGVAAQRFRAVVAPAGFAQAVQVMAMDGFAGDKTAAAEAVPEAVSVMDPFYVVAVGRCQARLDPPTHPAADTSNIQQDS
jgi:Transposase